MQRANFERRQGDLQTAEKLMRAAHAKAGPDDIVDITKQVRNVQSELRPVSWCERVISIHEVDP